jgi:hypothetical protein
MIRRLVQRWRCRRGRHLLETRYATAAGVAVAVTGCRACPFVDVEGIGVAAFNRRIRRMRLR